MRDQAYEKEIFWNIRRTRRTRRESSRFEFDSVGRVARVCARISVHVIVAFRVWPKSGDALCFDEKLEIVERSRERETATSVAQTRGVGRTTTVNNDVQNVTPKRIDQHVWRTHRADGDG